MATARVTRQFLDNYRKQVDAQADIAADYFGKAVDAFHASNPEASVAEFRNFVIDLYGVALPNFIDLEETLSCSIFDVLAEAVGFEGEKARTYDTIDYDQVEEKVHYMARHLANNDVESFKREVVNITRYYAKRSAFHNMERNCRAQKVKWARMPSGLETCPFCFMLASRGFVYANEKTASEGQHGYHNHCDCVAVPGFQDGRGNPRVKIDGYDPQTMADAWSKCEAAVGGREQARKEWDELSAAERNGYIARHGTEADAFARFEQNRILREIETRDWHWLYTGKGPAFKADESADPDEWELEAGKILREKCGFRVEFKARSLKDRRADIVIDGKKYEMKNPEGSMPLTVHNQVKKDLYGSRKQKVLNPQSDRIVISNVRSGIEFGEMVRQAKEVLGGYTGFNDEELGCINEIVILDRSGRMRRIKR